VRDRPIEVYRFGTGPHERLIVAGIHGGSEAITIALADQMIEHLKENPRLVPVEISLYILRSLNPDGEALYDKPLARYNANGVDLNRNFAANWKPTWSAQGCDTADTNTAGREPASEAETKAFVKFLSTRKIEALINYHSGGKGVFRPAPQLSPPRSGSLKGSQRSANTLPAARHRVRIHRHTGGLGCQPGRAGRGGPGAGLQDRDGFGC